MKPSDPEQGEVVRRFRLMAYWLFLPRNIKS